MSDIIHPGAGVLYMKVGTHAKEGLTEIIARKRREIDEAGFAMWGYGGSTCYPTSMVQPFARGFAARRAARSRAVPRAHERRFGVSYRHRR